MSVDRDRPDSVPTPEGKELWRVFVVLRNRPGLHERTIRASGPLDAEHAVAAADRQVLETLGSQLLGRHIPAVGGKPEYRSLEAGSRRLVLVRQNGPLGSAVLTPMPLVQVLTPKHDRGDGVPVVRT